MMPFDPLGASVQARPTAACGKATYHLLSSTVGRIGAGPAPFRQVQSVAMQRTMGSRREQQRRPSPLQRIAKQRTMRSSRRAQQSRPSSLPQYTGVQQSYVPFDIFGTLVQARPTAAYHVWQNHVAHTICSRPLSGALAQAQPPSDKFRV